MRWMLLGAVLLAGCLTTPDGIPGDLTGEVTFRPALDLGSMQYVAAAGTSCLEPGNSDCGLSEPSVEVDGFGTIYVSGVCCIGGAPPVYVSRDGGATFQTLDHPVREAFGIEGDFAIDGDGVVYFSDIELAASFQVTAWDADGTPLHHTKWPAPPLVDRDWIRAEGSGHLYYAYNSGLQTHVYKSEDGGRTWSPIPIYSTDYGLGNIAIHPGKEFCVIGGFDDGHRMTGCTTDGGASWQQEATTVPASGEFPVPVFDEAGNLHVASNANNVIQVTTRGTDGWLEPVTVSPEGKHRMPWLAAGRDGGLAVAWYGTPDKEPTSSSQWFLHVATTSKGGAWETKIADPEPVFVGDLQRELLDFLQVDLGPDGAIHVAYSRLTAEDDGRERLQYVRSEPTGLAALEFPYGPLPTP